jgi:hypothetical protein
VERPKAFGQTYELARAVEELAQMSERVLRAPERGSLEYQDRAIPKKALDMLGDTLCCVVHDKNDLDKEDMQNAMVLVHGKDLEAKVVQIGARFFVTPGRLTGGKQPTVGILDVQDKQVTFSAFTLDGSPVLEPQVLPLGGRTKLSVK